MNLGDGDAQKPPSIPKRRGLGDEFKGGDEFTNRCSSSTLELPGLGPLPGAFGPTSQRRSQEQGQELLLLSYSPS